MTNFALFLNRNLEKRPINLCMVAALCLFFSLTANAQLSLTNGSPSATINFSNTMPTTVGTNPSTAFTGAGFSPNPVTAGRLNSNAWAFTGWSDGALAYGGTNTAGDYAKGSTAVAITTGGIYAFVGAPNTVANPALMMQPGGSDFTPGTMTLKIQNNGTSIINQLAISYNIYVRNDQNRSQSFNLSYSTDDITYTPLPAMDYATPGALDAAGWVVVPGAPSRSTTITGLNVPGSGAGFIFIRWSSDDISGTGARDEIGLDDINLTANFPGACTPPTINATINSFSNVFSTQVDLNFTRGNGTGGLLIVASPAVLSQNPISGVIYSANSNYGSGAVLGNGFVVYNSNAVLPAPGGTGTATITGLTPGVNYTFTVFEYQVSVPCYIAAGVSATQTTLASSNTLATDQFRSRTNGSWANASTWESFTSGSWINADIAPTSAASTITIQAAHTVDINSTVSMDETVIAGTLTLSTGGIINLNNGTGNDIDIQNAGILRFQSTANYSTTFINAGAGTINVATGGKITIGNGGSCPGYSPLGYAVGLCTWNDASIFEWNTTDPFVTSGLITYFPGAAAGVIPVFRVSKTPSLQPGSSANTVWNGLFEVNAPLTLKLAGSKTFRNGIIGTADLTQDELCGQFVITGLTAKLGGTGAINLNAAGLDINSSSITTMISDKTVNSTLGVGTFSISTSSALYCDSYVMYGTAIFTLNTGNTLRLGSAAGISSAGPTGNIQVTGLRTYNANSNFIYNGTTIQITGAGLPATVNYLTIANTGAVGNNTVTLTTTNTSTLRLYLNSGLFAAGAGQQLNIQAAGQVDASLGGNFATGATAGILNFPGSGTFLGTCSPYDVFTSGAIDFGAGTVTIQSGGSFKINPGGGTVLNRGPFYSTTGSTLIYNTGGAFPAASEWVNGATGTQRGAPHHVTILASGTAVTFGTAASARTMRGDLLISSGTSLTLGTNPGGDLVIGGNWTRAASGSFTNNGRMVSFNGTTNNQTITVTAGGTEIFGLVNISKAVAFPNLYLAPAPNATSITINGNPGTLTPLNTLVIKDANIDLNQNTINFISWNNNQNNIQVDATGGGDLIRNITSTGGQGVFSIYNNTVANRMDSISRSSAATNRRAVLIFGSTVKVTIGAVAGGAAGFNFGVWASNVVGGVPICTINGILQLNTGGYVTTNPPYYGAGSTLVYNTTGAYDRYVEWGSTNLMSNTGYPQNVTIQNNTTLNLNNSANPPSTKRYMGGNLNIAAGSALVLNNTGTYNLNTITVSGNLVLDGTLTLPGTLPAFGEDLYLSGNWTRSATGVFNPNDRAVYFEGAGNSTITANNGETFPYLRIVKTTNAQSVFLADHVNITKEMSLTTGILDLQAKDLIFKSDATYTASLTSIDPANASINYSGTGRFIVERFIPTGTGGLNHGRTWQFLSVPTKGSTINNSWQEGYAPLAFTPAYNYGTTISSEKTGATGRGYDFYTIPGPSMKTYDYSIGTSGGWVSVDDGLTNTNAKLIDNVKGYMLFVRGDRSVQTSATTATPTTLRTRGKIYAPGAEAPPTITVQADKFESIGNPYPSAIDFSLLVPTGGVDNAFYVWDPTLFGNYGFGGYQTISAALGWIPSSAGTTNYPAATANKRIQSGQAFFVHATGSSGTVPFTEACKVTNSAVVFRPSAIRSVMRAALYNNANGNVQGIADGNAVAFDRVYSNGYDKFDALKMMNTGENFGIRRFGKVLAVEAHRAVENTDTIFYDLGNLRNQDYQLRFAPENLDLPGLRAYLVDRFTGSHSAVSLNSETVINFTVNNNAASSAANRFMLVFKKQQRKFFSSILTASGEDASVLLNWKTSGEEPGAEYDLERSEDGEHFSVIHHGVAGKEDQQEWIDENPLKGISYYRVHHLRDHDAAPVYSNRVSQQAAAQVPLVTIFPNPVKDRQMTLQFGAGVSGTCYLNLFSSTGQQVWTGTVTTAGNKGMKKINLPGTLAKGLYKLNMIMPDGTTKVLQVMID